MAVNPTTLTSLSFVNETLRSKLNLCQDVLFYSQAVIGDYKASARSEDYLGWLLCDGRLLDRTTYNALFELIGTTFGNTTSENFRLPDFRGKVFGALNTVSNKNNAFSTRNLGDFVGEEQHTLTINEMPSHNHDGATGAAGYNTGVQNITAAGGAGIDAADNTGSHTHTISSQGGDLPHNVMQPTLFGGNIMIFAGVPGGVPEETGSI